MPPESPYPTLSTRLFAAIADWGIVLVIASIFTAIFGRPTPDFGSYVWLAPWTFIVGWIYFATYESGHKGATPMKKFLNMRVTSRKGGKLPFWRAAIRGVVKMLPLVVVLIVLGPGILKGFPVERNTLKALGVFTAGFVLIQFVLLLIRGGRTLHDLAAGSHVLRTWGKL